LLGLAAYLALWLAAFWQTARAARRGGDPYARALALGTLGVLVHASVHNVVDNLWVHDMYLQVALLLGLVQRENLYRPSDAQCPPSDADVPHLSTRRQQPAGE
jgi:hypothetical protein